MLKWLDIKKMLNTERLAPANRVEKTDLEWKSQLTEEQFYITRKKGTERPHSSQMCSVFEPGKYACVCCDALLFDADEKYDSGSGWPSFTQPIQPNALAYHEDDSLGMSRVEVLCNACDAHLGHVFPDGPPPSGLRYCINAVAMKKLEDNTQKAVFGGGCFWCTEAMFQQLKGVEKVESGYSGGQITHPTYKEVCSGKTGHAEVIQVTYRPDKISFEDLIRIHLTTHDPTQLNQQGGDIGTQYRSVVFVKSDEERARAEKLINTLNEVIYEGKIVTEIKDFEVFYVAEDYHQNYFKQNADKNPYCTAVINPKVTKFRKQYAHLLK